MLSKRGMRILDKIY